MLYGGRKSVMQMSHCLAEHIAEPIRADGEAMRAVNEFVRNIPERVMQFDIDATRTNKQGLVNGESVYKLGVVVESAQTFIEFFEHRNQAEPSMALYADKAKAAVTIRGTNGTHTLYLAFAWRNGRVEKTSRLD